MWLSIPRNTLNKSIKLELFSFYFFLLQVVLHYFRPTQCLLMALYNIIIIGLFADITSWHIIIISLFDRYKINQLYADKVKLPFPGMFCTCIFLLRYTCIKYKNTKSRIFFEMCFWSHICFRLNGTRVFSIVDHNWSND